VHGHPHTKTAFRWFVQQWMYPQNIERQYP
jgi:hypothetical protein